jgi:aminoglycoside phosphotransferase (APT) family kinase protein
MTHSDRPNVADGVDLVRLGHWLDQAGIAKGGVRNPVRLEGGTQNLLLRFECGGGEFVLRRPPPNRDGAAKTVRRESIVLSALAESSVPHPRLRGVCMEDLSVAGGAFLIMDAVRGFNATTRIEGAAASNSAARYVMGLSMIDGLASLAAIRVDRGALRELGSANGWLERQRQRWARQLEQYFENDGWEGPAALGPIEAIGGWLDDHLPQDFQLGLMHGDYHIGNVLFRHEDGELAAIVDWELAALGDPLLDLGRLLTVWPDRSGETPLSLKVQPWLDFPGEDELVTRYAERTQRSLASLNWFKVLACYKYSIILEGTNARARSGRAKPQTGARLHASAVGLVRKAVALMEGA